METNSISNEKAILEQLLRGDRISNITVLNTVSTTEIRTYIARIRKTLKVSDEWVTKNGKRFKEYFIKRNNGI